MVKLYVALTECTSLKKKVATCVQLINDHEILKIATVEIYASRQKTSTVVFMDEGSTNTLIEEDSAIHVALKG